MSKQAQKKQGKQRKIDEVKSLEERLSKTKALFLTEYRGLTHQQMERLRKALKKVTAEYVVAKNSLFAKALESSKKNIANLKEITDQLKNPTATLFAYGDEIAAVKELAAFIKTIQLPKIKIGIFGDRVASTTDFEKLATLPTRDVLLATLASRLQSPISGLHYALRWNMQKLVIVLGNVKGKK